MPDEKAPRWDAIRGEVLEIVADWKTAYAEHKPSGVAGTLLFVFRFLFNALTDLVELVEVSAEIVKEDKKETVVEAIQYAYAQVNPDLPWIPEPFETKLETWLLETAVPAFIDWLVKTFNKHGIFTHDTDAETDSET